MGLTDYINVGIEQRLRLKSDAILIEKIEVLICEIIKSLNDGGKVFFAGNGGSAADSQHLAAEFVSRFRFDRPGLSALALTTDTSAITAIGNDYGFENLFSRQLEALARPGDVFIGFSTSGKSLNIINALEYAEENNIITCLFTGNRLIDYPSCSIIINVPSNETCYIQEMHITIGHYICGEVETRIFK